MKIVIRKSEHYTAAMVAVMDSERFSVLEKLDILEALMKQREHERWLEEKEAEKDAAVKEAAEGA